MGEEIIIVGAGISGLSAGCYAQMNGYKTAIYEMNKISGRPVHCLATERFHV